MTRFGSFLFLLRCCLLRRRRWSPGWLARQVGRARARACFSNGCMASPDRFGVAMGHCMHAMVRFHSHKHCAEMRGFLDFTWLGHDAKHMHHACVRKMHVIDRCHAWADRSPSFSFLRSRSVFCPSVGSWVDVRPMRPKLDTTCTPPARLGQSQKILSTARPTTLLDSQFHLGDLPLLRNARRVVHRVHRRRRHLPLTSRVTSRASGISLSRRESPTG